jgi:hypothetical protein
MITVVSGAEWLDERTSRPASETEGEGFPGSPARIMTCAEGAHDCLFRRTFTLPGPPAQAMVYLATRGDYELHANGRAVAVGGGCLRRFRAAWHRLAEALRAGDNTLALRVGRCGETAPRALLELRVAPR